MLSGHTCVEQNIGALIGMDREELNLTSNISGVLPEGYAIDAAGAQRAVLNGVVAGHSLASTRRW